MRNRRTFKLALLIMLLAATPLRAASPPLDETATAAPRDNPDRLEYQPGKLSDDAFAPSKEVSEDYPIPLPVDI